MSLDEWLSWRSVLGGLGEDIRDVLCGAEIVPPLVMEYFTKYWPNGAKRMFYSPIPRYQFIQNDFYELAQIIQNEVDELHIDETLDYVEEALPMLMDDPYIQLKKAILADYKRHINAGAFSRNIDIELRLWPTCFTFPTAKGYKDANLFTGDIGPHKSMDKRRDEWLAAMEIPD